MTTTIAKTLIRSAAFLTAGLLFGAHPASAAELELLWETKGFKNPESVAYDAKREQLFVSNIDGVPTQLDAQGGLTKLSMKGEIQDPNWAAIGMSSPAGLLVANDKLYVADVDRIVVFDIETHHVVDIFYAKPTAKFLNDIAIAPNGDLYISDLGARDIWRLKDEKLERWFNGNSSNFCRPNGLIAGQDALTIACWSQSVSGAAKGAEEGPGHLMSLRYDDQKLSSLGGGKPIGNLDGIQPVGNSADKSGYYLSDWTDGRFLRWTPEAGATSVKALAPGIADFLIIPERQMLVVPFMQDNLVRAYRFPSEKNTD